MNKRWLLLSLSLACAEPVQQIAAPQMDQGLDSSVETSGDVGGDEDARPDASSDATQDWGPPVLEDAAPDDPDTRIIIVFDADLMDAEDAEDAHVIIVLDADLVDAACQPQCVGRSCGDDGCGGVCGQCMPDLVCEDGQCACPGGQCGCIPQCEGVSCGEDGCGGHCGQCALNEQCVMGQCACAPDCQGRICGDDGCNGSCGECGDGSMCVGGRCEIQCEPDCAGLACGDDGCGGSCGQCGAHQACQAGQCQCVPDCAGLACGGDGCGGSCGQCGDNEACEAGRCEAQDPPWLVNGEARCPELAPFRDAAADASAVLQACIDRTPDGVRLSVEAGRYTIAEQLTISRAIGFGTLDREGGAACGVAPGHGCVELLIAPTFAQRLGALMVTGAADIDHIVIHGNRQQRGAGEAYQMCSTLADNSYGFNATLQCNNCSLTKSASIYALCGTGLLVIGPANNISITETTFAYNGLHNTQNMWADGLTVHESTNSTFNGNTFIDNTDIDLIFGGCQGCSIQNNEVNHGPSPDAGAFAAIMIQKWPNTSGSYLNSEITGNRVDCGPQRTCGSGLYIGSEGWYPETPYATRPDGGVGSQITGNTVRNTMNALYIAAHGFEIHSNDFVNTHGVAIPSNCGRHLVSETPIIVSPTTQNCHFGGENVDPNMSMHYSSQDWSGCIPNFTL